MRGEGRGVRGHLERHKSYARMRDASKEADAGPLGRDVDHGGGGSALRGPADAACARDTMLPLAIPPLVSIRATFAYTSIYSLCIRRPPSRVSCGAERLHKATAAAPATPLRAKSAAAEKVLEMPRAGWLVRARQAVAHRTSHTSAAKHATNNDE